MKVIKKARNPYIESNKRRNLIIFILLIVIGISLFALGMIFTKWLILAAVVPVTVSAIFRRRYNTWKAGATGEKAVAKALRTLDDSYYLLNAVVLPGGRGDIDHVLLGSKGVFVIEAKNYSGKVMCNGDDWYRRKRGAKKTVRAESVSEQVRRNASDLNNYLRRRTRLNLHVNPVCVFVNPMVQLDLKNPTVPVLRLDQLTRFIRDAESSSSLSEREMKSVAQSLLKVPAK